MALSKKSAFKSSLQSFIDSASTNHIPPQPERKVKIKRAERIGQRGKDAEKDVRQVLEGWNNLACFAFDRLPDARAARGRMKSSLADYMVWYAPGGHRFNIPLEVKSTEHSTKRGGYLLSASALDQLPLLKKVALAGANPFVLVYFKKFDYWRVAHIHFFSFGESSWDMSECPTFPTAKAALESTGFFPTGTAQA